MGVSPPLDSLQKTKFNIDQGFCLIFLFFFLRKGGVGGIPPSGPF